MPKEHYENHLAKYYSWMSGGFARKIEENRNFFKDRHVRPCRSGVAVDLGAGSGFQSIPLAEIGFRVIAVDLSRTLLAELEKNAVDLSIEIINDDLSTFSKHCPGPVELVVCMGDTLAHLDTHQNIRHLLKRIYSALETGGRVILTFRDLTVELKGLDRFIPVRSDANTIFTCFLEYGKNHVVVHDIINERKNSQWDLRINSFKKIRISPRWTKDTLKDIGFKVETFDIQNAVVCIIAQKI
jgi:2-polyprenyl-3-methyl-5-hydroxy-6-metoxy-1,4-benzoquinol methylase